MLIGSPLAPPGGQLFWLERKPAVDTAGYGYVGPSGLVVWLLQVDRFE